MAALKDLLHGNADALVRLFYKIRVPETKGFIARIDTVAEILDLNHAQLVCGLGFNFGISDLPDVRSIVGFTNDKSLYLRRDEIFKNDIYEQLSVDDVIDIYAHCLNFAAHLSIIQDLATERLSSIERAI